MAVIDANVGVWTVLPVLAAVEVGAFLADPARSDEPLAAPMLWLAESVSVVRGYVFAGALTDGEGRRAIDTLLGFDLDLVPLDGDLCRGAYEWARRLGQRRAYDGFYLALAERLAVPFWTADRRLFQAARTLRLGWVHWAGPATADTAGP